MASKQSRRFNEQAPRRPKSQISRRSKRNERRQRPTKTLAHEEQNLRRETAKGLFEALGGQTGAASGVASGMGEVKTFDQGEETKPERPVDEPEKEEAPQEEPKEE